MSQLETFLEHFSDEPWSNFKQSDYSVEQWHAACLIHNHEGEATSKSQCKLPCKTPAGVTNKNAVYAAVAALAGARGGVDATPEQKASAAKTLAGYYKDMGKDIPPSLMSVMHSDDTDIFLEHFGIKGMKWGVRNRRTIAPNSKKQYRKTSQDYRKAQQLKKRGHASLSNDQLKKVNERLNLEQNYRRLNPTALERLKREKKTIEALLATVGITSIAAIAQTDTFKKVVQSGKNFIMQRRNNERVVSDAFKKISTL